MSKNLSSSTIKEMASNFSIPVLKASRVDTVTDFLIKLDNIQDLNFRLGIQTEVQLS